jgi:hypothetical protein
MAFTTPPQTPRGNDSTPPQTPRGTVSTQDTPNGFQTPDQPIPDAGRIPVGVFRENMVSLPIGYQTPDLPITNPGPNPPGVTRENTVSRPVTNTRRGLIGNSSSFLTPPSPEADS